MRHEFENYVKTCANVKSVQSDFLPEKVLGEVKGNRSLFLNSRLLFLLFFLLFLKTLGEFLGGKGCSREGIPLPLSSRKPVNVDLVKLNGLNPDNN